VLAIDPSTDDVPWLRRRGQRDPDVFRFDRVTGQCVIGQEHGDAGLLCVANCERVDGMVEAVDQQPLVTQTVQQLKRPVDRFRNTVKREQAKAAVEWRRGEVVLLRRCRRTSRSCSRRRYR
jgi:hypothetical protein